MKNMTIYQIKVTLKSAKPPIWRRILVPANTNLLKLHDILQIVMGWEDYHLHLFKFENAIYCSPFDDDGGWDTLDEADYKLSEVIHGEGQSFVYEYDFGDSWKHVLRVEKILSSEAGVHYPVCLKGKGACPPEDVGGVWGYVAFIDAISDPDHPEHDEYLEWVGGEFDPDHFDLQEVNAELRGIGRGKSIEKQNSWYLYNEAALTEEEFANAVSWVEKLPEDNRVVAENLPLRRDVIALLTYIQNNKVTGTPSTGNLPLKAVREICSQFVNPPRLEEVIGEHVFRVRSENEVRSLYFRHVLASVGGLITGGPGRRWRLAPCGDRFLNTSAPAQVWLLSAVWWTQVNWAITAPYSFNIGYMSYEFSKLVLMHLIDIDQRHLEDFDSFTDRIIEVTGLFWPIQDQERAHSILRIIIERMVIDPLIEFGILQAEYEAHKTLGPEFSTLSAFKVTPFGNDLLQSMMQILT
jgi:hypothetical protein